jgi:hypothetical protein
MWSLAVNRCLASGGHFGEIHWALKDLQEAAKVAPQGDQEAWHAAWMKLAHQTEKTGLDAVAKGHRTTAASQFYRAAQYFQWAEAFLDPNDPRAKEIYALHLDAFAKATKYMTMQVELVDVPFENTSLTAYFVR